MSNIEYDEIKKVAKQKLTVNIKTLTCSMLKKNKDCAIYFKRPTICRIYGLTKDLKCPHGCIPSRWLDKNEVDDILDKIEELDDYKEPIFSCGNLIEMLKNKKSSQDNSSNQLFKVQAR